MYNPPTKVFAQTSAISDDTYYLSDDPDTGYSTWYEEVDITYPGYEPAYYNYGGFEAWGYVIDDYYNCSCAYKDGAIYEATDEELSDYYNSGAARWYFSFDYYGDQVDDTSCVDCPPECDYEMTGYTNFGSVLFDTDGQYWISAT